MEFTGKVAGVGKDYLTNKWQITFTVNEEEALSGVEELNKSERLTVKAHPYRKRRSKDANALLWACLGDLARAHRTDNWSMYLAMLRDYGKCTYICVRPEVVEAVKAQWRECEEQGVIYINGEKAIQLRCYFGSSTYNTAEFSALLDGVIYEMKEAGLAIPLREDVERSLDLWSKNHE